MFSFSIVVYGFTVIGFAQLALADLDNTTTEEPKVIKSVPTTVKVFENSSVILPCHIDFSEQDIELRWYRGGDVLGDSMTPHKALPEKYSWFHNGSLEVIHVDPTDSGEYTCEVIRAEPWAPIRQTHIIEVQYQPIIKTIPEDGYLQVGKDTEVEIGCDVEGVPAPSITWYKNGEELPLLDQRDRMKFKPDNKNQGGKFACRASNGIGDPVEAIILVLVEHAPILTPASMHVHTGIGLRAALDVRVEALPAAKSIWYRDGNPVVLDSRVLNAVTGERNQLVFRNVRESDLGTYTFRASNSWGMVDANLKLSATPKPAVFKVDSAINNPTATGFTLIWTVDSYAPIIEYNLWVRPYIDNDVETGKNPWRMIVVPSGEFDGPIHSCNYTVRGLTPSTSYESMVTSKNKYGWSNPSAILHFRTEPGVWIQPSTVEYDENLATPLYNDFKETEQNGIKCTTKPEQIKNNGAKIRPFLFKCLILYFICIVHICLNGRL